MLKNYASLAKWKREGKRYFIEYTNMFFDNVHAEIVGTMGPPSYILGSLNSLRHSLKDQNVQASAHLPLRTLNETDFPIKIWPG